MAGHAAPNIVENGLVFYVDAANSRSYPRSGTTWFDIINSNNGTLASSPTFENISFIILFFLFLN